MDRITLTSLWPLRSCHDQLYLGGHVCCRRAAESVVVSDLLLELLCSNAMPQTMQILMAQMDQLVVVRGRGRRLLRPEYETPSYIQGCSSVLDQHFSGISM